MVNVQHEIWCKSDWFLLQYLSSYRCSWAFMFRQVFGFFLFGHSFQAMSFDMLFHVVSISAMINLIICWRKYLKIISYIEWVLKYLKNIPLDETARAIGTLVGFIATMDFAMTVKRAWISKFLATNLASYCWFVS